MRWTKTAVCVVVLAASGRAEAEHRNDGSFERGAATSANGSILNNGQSIRLFPSPRGATQQAASEGTGDAGDRTDGTTAPPPKGRSLVLSAVPNFSQTVVKNLVESNKATTLTLPFGTSSNNPKEATAPKPSGVTLPKPETPPGIGLVAAKITVEMPVQKSDSSGGKNSSGGSGGGGGGGQQGGGGGGGGQQGGGGGGQQGGGGGGQQGGGGGGQQGGGGGGQQGGGKEGGGGTKPPGATPPGTRPPGGGTAPPGGGSTPPSGGANPKEMALKTLGLHGTELTSEQRELATAIGKLSDEEAVKFAAAAIKLDEARKGGNPEAVADAGQALRDALKESKSEAKTALDESIKKGNAAAFGLAPSKVP